MDNLNYSGEGGSFAPTLFYRREPIDSGCCRFTLSVSERDKHYAGSYVSAVNSIILICARTIERYANYLDAASQRHSVLMLERGHLDMRVQSTSPADSTLHGAIWIFMKKIKLKL